MFVNAIILNKLDYNSRREFENTLGTTLPKRSDLIDFLERKCVTLESMKQESKVKPSTSFYNPIKKMQPSTIRTSHHVITSKLICYYCKCNHAITRCSEFLALSVPERHKQVQKRSLCQNCLRDNHDSSACKSVIPCKLCNRTGHHTLLHRDIEIRLGSSSSKPPEVIASSVTASSYSKRTEPNVILSTAVVLAEDSRGNFHKCRCLLDVGSQLNLLSSKFKEKLNLKTDKVKMSVCGIGETCTNVSESTNIVIKSVHTQFTAKINCYISERVTVDLSTASFDLSQFIIPDNVQLADPQFNVSGPIDLIIGAEVFWSILSHERIKLSNPNLYLSETLLGWVVGGAIHQTKVNSKLVCNRAVKNSKDTQINEIVEKFWKQEEVSGLDKKCSAEEISCENHFLNTFRYDNNDDRFVVKLPFKNNQVVLGDSSKSALRRFMSLENKFRRDPEFKDVYVKAFEELRNSGIIEGVPVDDLYKKFVFFLPHSGVFKRNSDTPKVRIVFDGSAKSSNGRSLNDRP